MTNRIKSAALAAIIGCVILIFVSSFREERDLSAASSSFAEMHDDRLMAEQLIYKMSDLLHRKQLSDLRASDNAALTEREGRLFAERVRGLIRVFAGTRFTAKERLVFSRLTAKVELLLHEKNGGIAEDSHAGDRSALYAEILMLLDQLSDIQVVEGKKLKDQAQATLADSIIGINLQWSLFLVFLLSLVALIRSTWIRIPIAQQHEMN